MFKARTADGRNNISGLKVKELRKALQISQRELSDRLQVNVWISTKTQSSV